MMKTRTFKAIALGLLSYASVSGAAAATKCPAFNDAMVDATMMVIDISGPLDDSSFAMDDARRGRIRCFLVTDEFNTFEVMVDPDDTLLVGASSGGQLRTRVGPGANGVVTQVVGRSNGFECRVVLLRDD